MHQINQCCLQIQQVGIQILPDKSRSPPALRDFPDPYLLTMAFQSDEWGSEGGAGCILRKWHLINLDSFQQPERPHTGSSQGPWGAEGKLATLSFFSRFPGVQSHSLTSLLWAWPTARSSRLTFSSKAYTSLVKRTLRVFQLNFNLH